MRITKFILALSVLLAMAVSALAVEIPKGTPVMLAFDQRLTSKTAKAGDRVRLHVSDDVIVHGKTVIPQGTRVTAIVNDVKGRGRFGKNAQLKLDIDPIRVGDMRIPVQPRQKGNMVGGSRGTQAAGVAGAGAIVLGPLGLGAGYFVVGKEVNVKPGDHIETQVSEDVETRRSH